MENIRIKDVIFSFRHLYLDNLKKINKRLKKHISIDSHLVDDVTLYLKTDKYSDDKIDVKYRFKKGTIGSFVLNTCEKLYINTNLNEIAEISKDSLGKYTAKSSYISLKDEKIDREVECILKEEFYQFIASSYRNGKIAVTFSGYDITFSSGEFIVCYNAVGDVIYAYSYKPMDINQILDTVVDSSIDDDYHSSLIQKSKKSVESVEPEIDEVYPGNYSIKETENSYVLKKIRKNQLSRLI